MVIVALNNGRATASGGDDAYEVGTGNLATGAVGVNFVGNYASKYSILTINRPACAGLSVDITTITPTEN